MSTLAEKFHTIQFYLLSMRGSIIWTCSSCLKAERSEASRLRNRVAAFRAFRSAPPLASAQVAATKAERDDGREADKERGAMSRRLAEMTEEAVDIGGSSTAKNVEAAGFSEELKKKLEARIVEGAFRSQNQRSFAEAELPVCIYLASFQYSYKYSPSTDIRRQRHTRTSVRSTMDRFRVTPRFYSENA